MSDDPLVVVLPDLLSDAYIAAVKAASPRVQVVLIGNDVPLPPEVAGATVLYRSWGLRRRIVDAVIEKARDLRWMHVPSAGVDIALSPNVLARDFTITHLVGPYDEPCAEFALTLLLTAAKRIPAFVHAQREGKWAGVRSWDRLEEEVELPLLVSGKTLGIVGFGGIGKRLAELARPFHMRVLGYRRQARPDRRAEVVYGPGQLDDLLRQSDFVVLALALTSETTRVIDSHALTSMKGGAWLINIARGGLIDDDALVAALRERRIGGACLDAFAREPLAADHPYWSLSNVVMTPHAAGALAEVGDLDREIFVEQLLRFVGGKPLKNRVIRARGY